MSTHSLVLFTLIAFILVAPLLFTVINTINLIKKKPIKPQFFDVLTMILGFILSTLLCCLSGPDYNEPVVIGGGFAGGIPLHSYLASWHAPTIMYIALLGITAFIILTKCQNKLPPLIAVLCLSGVYIGIGLSVIFIIQTSPQLFEGYIFFGIYAPLFPINYILCSVRVIRKTIKAQVKKSADYAYKNPFMMKAQKIVSHSVSWLIIPFVLALPLLGLLVLILTLFGQQPDAVIKAFTETSDWTLSQKISPPPIRYEGHYLCTVAVSGNKKLVKPSRVGIRHGVKIVVNRQLCIANAFEQVIEEKLPRLHRVIRNFYDTYGYPLSKKITTQKRANAVYILMKPLEWIFLVFLYAADINPENRIATQYTKR